MFIVPGRNVMSSRGLEAQHMHSLNWPLGVSRLPDQDNNHFGHICCLALMPDNPSLSVWLFVYRGTWMWNLKELTLRASSLSAANLRKTNGASSAVSLLCGLRTTAASATCPSMDSDTANAAASATSGCSWMATSTCSHQQASRTESNANWHFKLCQQKSRD